MSDGAGRYGGQKSIRASLHAARETAERDAPELYQFGPFLLEPAERRLLRGNEVVALTPKAFDTLVLLVRNSGHLLEKDELIRLLWPNSFIEEGNLSNNIFLLRKVLGEDPQYIETVPTRGYRFVGAIRQIPSGLEVSGDHRAADQIRAVEPVLPGAGPARSTAAVAATALTLLAVGGSSGGAARFDPRTVRNGSN